MKHPNSKNENSGDPKDKNKGKYSRSCKTIKVKVEIAKRTGAFHLSNDIQNDDFSVEGEQEREKHRKMEDTRRDE